MTAIFDHLLPAMLVMFRISGIMLYGPVFGSQAIPVRVKVFLTVLLGLSVYPVMAERIAPDLPLQFDLFMLAPLVAMEMMLGLIIGFIASLPLIAVQTGGLVMGQQMGLGFARFYNPTVDDEADVLGQVLFFMALAGFLVVGGHEAMVLAVMHSFEIVPLGGFAPDLDLIGLICGILLSAFELALRIAAPLLALIFLESVAMGFIAKTVPQLNILSLGFPIRILVGLFIVAMGLIVINDVIIEEINTTLHLLFTWLDTLGIRAPAT